MHAQLWGHWLQPVYFWEAELWRCAVIKVLTAEKVTLAKIDHHLKDVYGDNAGNKPTVNWWVVKFCDCDPGKDIIIDETCNRYSITATYDKYCKLANDFFKIVNLSC